MAAPRRVNLLDRPPPADLKSPLVKLAPPPADEFEIEDGIPIPSKTVRTPVTQRMPFGRLEIGQSFYVAGDRAAKNSSFWVKRAQIKFPGKYFTARKVDGGVRIWRVEATR